MFFDYLYPFAQEKVDNIRNNTNLKVRDTLKKEFALPGSKFCSKDNLQESPSMRRGITTRVH